MLIPNKYSDTISVGLNSLYSLKHDVGYIRFGPAELNSDLLIKYSYFH